MWTSNFNRAMNFGKNNCTRVSNLRPNTERYARNSHCWGEKQQDTKVTTASLNHVNGGSNGHGNGLDNLRLNSMNSINRIGSRIGSGGSNVSMVTLRIHGMQAMQSLRMAGMRPMVSQTSNESGDFSDRSLDNQKSDDPKTNKNSSNSNSNGNDKHEHEMETGNTKDNGNRNSNKNGMDKLGKLYQLKAPPSLSRDASDLTRDVSFSQIMGLKPNNGLDSNCAFRDDDDDDDSDIDDIDIDLGHIGKGLNEMPILVPPKQTENDSYYAIGTININERNTIHFAHNSEASKYVFFEIVQGYVNLFVFTL